MNEKRIGIAEWCSPIQGPMACRMAAELGLDGVELDLGEARRCLPLSDPGVQKYWLDARQKYAVAFPALAVNALGGCCSLRPKDAAQEALCHEIVTAAIEAASALGIGILQIPNFADFTIRGREDIEPAARFFQWACAAAEQSGIVVGSENTLNGEENLLLGDRVNRPNFKIYFDNENAVFFRGEDPAEQLRRLGDRICQVHMKDGTAEALSSRLLGEGHGQAEECLNAMRDIGYGGWVVLENEYDTGAFNCVGRFAALQRDIEWLKERL